jgi:hypothetical protein
MRVKLFQIKKYVELKKLKNILAKAGFFSIINVFDECSAEFFIFKNDLNTINLKVIKFKKNYYNSLLGKQTCKMLPKMHGTNMLIYSDDVDFCNFNQYFAILIKYKTQITHIYTYLWPFVCGLERLQAIYFCYKENNFCALSADLQFNLLLPNLLIREVLSTFYSLIDITLRKGRV